jgi:hypothetical protein
LTSNRLIRVGAVAGVFFAICSTLVSDMHTVADLVLDVAKNSGAAMKLMRGLEFPFWMTGVVAGPVVAVSAFLFGLGFIGARQRGRDTMATLSAAAAFVYCAAEIFAAVADVHYARAIEGLQIVGDMGRLNGPGTLRGISALAVGVIGGIVMTFFIAMHFQARRIRIGKVGALLALASVLTGILVKTLSLWLWPYELMAAFLVLMGLKSVGIALISGALYQEAPSCRSAVDAV